jgi:hypothetical protein
VTLLDMLMIQRIAFVYAGCLSVSDVSKNGTLLLIERSDRSELFPEHPNVLLPTLE